MADSSSTLSVQDGTASSEPNWTVHHIKKEVGKYSDALNNKILNHLKALQLLTDDQIKEIYKIYTARDTNIADILVQNHFMKEDEVTRVMADFFNCSYVSLKDKKIDPKILLTIPQHVAENDMVIAFQENDSEVSLAMLNPTNVHFIHLAEKKFGKKARVFYTTPKNIYNALKNYKGGLSEGIDYLVSRAALDIEHLDSLENIASIFDTLILMAYNRDSSDIHIEPFEDEIRIRFRVDGMLQTITTLPLTFLDTIINHVKVLSKLRTDEHSSAQDGRFNLTYEQVRIHFRVSIIPTHYGEKIVLRLLPVDSQGLSLVDLGHRSLDREAIEKNIRKSSGIVLITGPTGSGKTTTLYSVLKMLNDDNVNISTIEDPIEYGIAGINQIQVNSKTNITFAEGLKSLLRQDPDILMIGEIRDGETAKIAMHAALTGHLVLSTLHTNNAPLAPLRLIQMGVDPYLIVSTVNLIAAQRLLRKICPDCMTSYKLTDKDIKTFNTQFLVNDEEKELFNQSFVKDGDPVRLFKGKGCKKCGNTGYQGRTVISEVMEIDDTIGKLIIGNAFESDIRAAAKKQGMTTMLEDGFEKVLWGVTTIDELFRVLNQ